MATKERISQIFEKIYGNGGDALLKGFLRELDEKKALWNFPPQEPGWYKDLTVYSLYVDLFNKDFKGLENKLDYLNDLGVSCLWLLPILDSPLRDAGFDIRDYRKIRPELLAGGKQDEVFGSFLNKAHSLGIKVLFDIAVNHTSDEHPWFLQAKSAKDNPYRDFYIWSDDEGKYSGARVIFEGIETSNWKKCGDEYYFHRFFDFQPDLNYRNPKVLLEMSRNFLFWLEKGVDGFRVDAIPYLWKEEGTNCENLPMTHNIVKFFRAVVDYVRPNTLLLAEACQKPVEVVKYFGGGDECHAGYHFPLMPQIYKMMKMQDFTPVTETLDEKVTPSIGGESQWFTFLRCHDELSLELVYVSEDDRRYIHQNYCKEPLWDFRKGQGISARLAELMDRNPDKIALIFSIMLTLPGTPVIYYGDEFGKLNDLDYYREQIKATGKDDTRFLVRGHIDWPKLEQDLKDESTLSFKVYSRLRQMLKARSQTKVFGRGSLEWLDFKDKNGNAQKDVLAFYREFEGEKYLLIHNLSGETREVSPGGLELSNLLPQINKAAFDFAAKTLKLAPYGYYWLRLANSSSGFHKRLI